MTKTILILASSIRQSHRCIGGREVFKDNSSWRCGKWVRPVSPQGAGEVQAHQSLCTDDTQPRVYDIVTVPLQGPAPLPHQPENYLIDETTRWNKIDRSAPNLSAIVETPASLWQQAQVPTHRIHQAELEINEAFQSMYLIRPTNLRVRVWTEFNQAKGRNCRKRKALFDYAGATYFLPITDPLLDLRYCQNLQPLTQEPQEVNLATRNCLLCVSLAAPFKDGYHYKLVASILEY